MSEKVMLGDPEAGVIPCRMAEKSEFAPPPTPQANVQVSSAIQQTENSTAFADIPLMNISIISNGRPLLVIFKTIVNWAADDDSWASFQILVDNVPTSPSLVQIFQPVSNTGFQIQLPVFLSEIIYGLPVGNRTIKIQWKSGIGNNIFAPVVGYRSLLQLQEL